MILYEYKMKLLGNIYSLEEEERYAVEDNGFYYTGESCNDDLICRSDLVDSDLICDEKLYYTSKQDNKLIKTLMIQCCKKEIKRLEMLYKKYINREMKKIEALEEEAKA